MDNYIREYVPDPFGNWKYEDDLLIRLDSYILQRRYTVNSKERMIILKDIVYNGKIYTIEEWFRFVIYNIYFFDLKKIENIGPMTNEQEAT